MSGLGTHNVTHCKAVQTPLSPREARVRRRRRSLRRRAVGGSLVAVVSVPLWAHDLL